MDKTAIEDFLKDRGFKITFWSNGEGLVFTSIFKKLGNGIKLELTITTKSNSKEYHSHTYALSIDNKYAEIALDSIEEFKLLIKILDK